MQTYTHVRANLPAPGSINPIHNHTLTHKPMDETPGRLYACRTVGTEATTSARTLLASCSGSAGSMLGLLGRPAAW